MTNTEALRKALAVIETDRRALLYSHAYPAGSLTIPADDEAGADALAQYDEAIHAIRTVLAQQPAASGGPVAWHMRAIGCDGSADWCELGAAPPEPVHGVEVLPLVYAAAQPAPARVPLTDAQVLDLQSRYGWAKATIRAIEDLIFAAPCTANGRAKGPPSGCPA